MSSLGHHPSHLKVHMSQPETIIILPSHLPINECILFPRMNTSLYLVVQAKNLGIILGQHLSLE